MKKLNIGKMALTLSLMSAISVSSVFPVLAGTWEQTGEQWKYMDDSGGYVANGWEQISDEYYYFDENSLMLSSTITPDGYIVNEKGAWIQGVVTSTPENDGWSNQEKSLELGREIQKAQNWEYLPIKIYSPNNAGFGKTSSDAITLSKSENEYTFNIYSKIDSNHPNNKLGLQALCWLLGNDGDIIYYSIVTDYENEIFKADTWTKVENREYKLIENDNCLTYIVK